jgi:hypothetical protein
VPGIRLCMRGRRLAGPGGSVDGVKRCGIFSTRETRCMGHVRFFSIEKTTKTKGPNGAGVPQDG